MEILVDTNIVIDYLLKREGSFEAVERIMDLIESGAIKGYISTQTVADLFYILRKDFSASERRRLLLSLCDLLSVVGVDRAMLVRALANGDFSDFEDCLQSECAKSVFAQYIVTRNTKDYSTSEVEAIMPGDFLRRCVNFGV